MALCNDQQSFNTAMKEFLKSERPPKRTMMVALVVYLVLLVWSVMLALSLQASSKGEKILNIVLSILCPPVYIIGFYSSDLKIDM